MTCGHHCAIAWLVGLVILCWSTFAVVILVKKGVAMLRDWRMPEMRHVVIATGIVIIASLCIILFGMYAIAHSLLSL